MSGSAASGGTPRGIAREPPAEGSPPPDRPPFLLDFYPLEEAGQTRLAPFYEALRAGRLTTTRCEKDGRIAWPPRVVCPHCHSDRLAWVDLPRSGTLYAFSAVLAGAPLGMEADVPFAVGLVDLDGVPLRMFSRLIGRPWSELAIGDPVAFEPFDLPDGRVYYRFRA